MKVILEQAVRSAAPAVTQRVLAVASMFGLGLDDGGPDERAGGAMIIVPRTEIELPLPGPGVTFITGPSGSGKSTLQRLIAQACAERGAMIHDWSSSVAGDDAAAASAVIDLIAPRQSLEQALEMLSLTGLGDAFVMLRQPHELSDGQRFRFRLAQLLANTDHRAGRPAGVAAPALIVIDEFAACLDRETAIALARNLRRWSDRAGVSFALATTHDDLLEALDPDVLIHKPLGPGIEVIARSRRWNAPHHLREEPIQHAGGERERDDDDDRQPQREDHPLSRDALLLDEPGIVAAHAARMLPRASVSPSADEFVIQPGTMDDYRALAAFHYRANHAGGVTSVLRMISRRPTVVGRFLQRRGETTTVGVLVRSLPSLNGLLRDRATAGRYLRLTPHERGVALNREIRCISRVVIDPRFRGTGLAVRLVRHALEHPESDRLLFTEALAAMGRVSPFFQRAGMRRYDVPAEARPAHARLLDALRHAGLEPHDLAALPRDAWFLAAITPSPSLAMSAADSGVQPHGGWARFDRTLLRWLVQEARRFLRAAGRVSRGGLDAMSPRELLIAARERLLLQPVYFIHAHVPVTAVPGRCPSHIEDSSC